MDILGNHIDAGAGIYDLRIMVIRQILVDAEDRLPVIVLRLRILFVRPQIPGHHRKVHRLFMQHKIKQHDPASPIGVLQVLLMYSPSVDLHEVLTEDVIPDAGLSVILFTFTDQEALFRLQPALLLQHHHGYKAGNLQGLILFDILLRIPDDHEAQRMLSEGHTDYSVRFQSLICRIFTRTGLPDRLNVLDDERLLFLQMLYPCKIFLRHFKFMKQRFRHRSGMDIVPDLRTPQL